MPRCALRRLGLLCGAIVLLAGCGPLARLGGGPQSALSPAGRDAERMADLFAVMTVGAAIIWTAVVGLAFYASRWRTHEHPERYATALIVGGGAVFPLVVLTALLVYGLTPLPDVLALPPAGRLTIAVTGEQWWWRVRYQPPDGAAFELANEIRLPVGERVEVQLASADVIHSFWVPSLAGKLDMVPGRVNRIALEPTRAGVFRGQCAEYCGTSHAFMSFFVVAMERDAFERWLQDEQRDATPPAEPVAATGQTAFLANGCGACHTVRGTPADGVVGPDLTHVGGRVSLAAGTLRNTPGDLQRWIEATNWVKPGVHMPAYDMLNGADLVPLAAYLSGLR
jgi:cytochrome c oxidase subunit 2